MARKKSAEEVTGSGEPITTLDQLSLKAPEPWCEKIRAAAALWETQAQRKNGGQTAVARHMIEPWMRFSAEEIAAMVWNGTPLPKTGKRQMEDALLTAVDAAVQAALKERLPVMIAAMKDALQGVLLEKDAGTPRTRGRRGPTDRAAR